MHDMHSPKNDRGDVHGRSERPAVLSFPRPGVKPRLCFQLRGSWVLMLRSSSLCCAYIRVPTFLNLPDQRFSCPIGDYASFFGKVRH